MKVLEMRIVVADFTSDEYLCELANVIKQEIGATGIDVHDVVYSVKPENAISANFVM
jgi:S-adenosylmethionine hydrolase